MSDNFPLTRALGLEVLTTKFDISFGDSYPGGVNIASERRVTEHHTVRAADLEALLAKAPVVWLRKANKRDRPDIEWDITQDIGFSRTGTRSHTALLVGITKIEKKCPTCGKDGYDHKD